MLAHQRQRLLAAMKNGIDIDRKAAFPIVEIAGLDIAAHADTGIVHQDIETADILARSVHGGFPVNGIGNVVPDRMGGAVTQIRIDERGGFGSAITVDIGAQHPRALFGQPGCMGPAEPLRRACHQCQLACTPSCHRHSPANIPCPSSKSTRTSIPQPSARLAAVKAAMSDRATR